MRHLIGIVAIAVFLAPASAQPGDQILTFTGLPPVQVGMAVSEAERALGYRLKPLDTSDRVSTEACWLTERADGTQRWLTYMVRNGKITRIDVWGEEGHPSDISSKDGLRIGSAEDAVMRTHGKALEISGHPHLGADGRYLVLPAPDKRHGLLFETVHGKVVNLRAGELESISLMETCA